MDHFVPSLPICLCNNSLPSALQISHLKLLSPPFLPTHFHLLLASVMPTDIIQIICNTQMYNFQWETYQMSSNIQTPQFSYSHMTLEFHSLANSRRYVRIIAKLTQMHKSISLDISFMDAAQSHSHSAKSQHLFCHFKIMV